MVPADQNLTNLESKPSTLIMTPRNKGHGLDELPDAGRALSGNHDMLYEVDVWFQRPSKAVCGKYPRPPERASL